MNISCPVFVPCPDSPILNLSAEDPDVFYWPGYFYPQPCRQILCPPTFYQKDCFGVVYSATSQADADALAQQASVNCQDRGVSCTNEPQTATVTCANGTVVSFTCPAGTFNVSIMGTLAACQAAANAQALAYAQQQASLLAQTTCVSNQTHCSFTTGATLPDGVVGTSYVKQLVVSISGLPVGFFVVSGSLPPGLALNSSGTITGVPTTSGTYQFSVRGSSPATSCTKQFQIEVIPKITAYWNLDQATVDAVQTDSVGGSNLVPPDSPTGPGVAAKIGNGVHFSSAINGSHGYAVSNSKFDYAAGESFSYWGWFKIIGIGAEGGLGPYISFYNTGFEQLIIELANSNNPGNVHIGDGTNDVYFNVSTGMWHFFHVFYNGSTGGYSIDNSAEVLMTNPSNWITHTNNVFFLASGALVAPCEVIFDEIGIVMGSKLTAAQVSYLYNSGAGRTWPITLP